MNTSVPMATNTQFGHSAQVQEVRTNTHLRTNNHLRTSTRIQDKTNMQLGRSARVQESFTTPKWFEFAPLSSMILAKFNLLRLNFCPFILQLIRFLQISIFPVKLFPMSFTTSIQESGKLSINHRQIFSHLSFHETRALWPSLSIT